MKNENSKAKIHKAKNKILIIGVDPAIRQLLKLVLVSKFFEVEESENECKPFISSPDG